MKTCDITTSQKRVFGQCPSCGKLKDMRRPAISRLDNTTKICSACGRREAVLDFVWFTGNLNVRLDNKS